jgi:hypothetical protein
MVVLLIHKERPDHSGHVEKMLDAAVTHLGLSLDMLSLLLRAVMGQQRAAEALPSALSEDSMRPNLCTSLLDSLISLSFFLLLAPVRIRDFDSTHGVSTLTKEFVVTLLLELGHESQGRLISSLLHLDEELYKNLNETNASRPANPVSETRNRCTDTSGNIQMVCSMMFEVLASAAKKNPQIMIPFKQVLINKLKSSEWIGEYADGALQHLCALISFLEGSSHKQRGGTEQVVSDVFLTIRSLLFSPSNDFPPDERKNIDRCVRGLVLAVEVVAGDHLSHAKILTIWQSVQTILLPPTNRIVNPRVGLYALKFVRTLREWNRGNNNKKSASTVDKQIFQTTTHVLSNSRVIQYVTSYNERQKEHTALGYTERPSFFESGARKRKFRRMVFCFEAFSRDKSMVCPSSWRDTSRWVFDVVDTYLTIGRTASLSSETTSKGKWSPHTWVEAAVEYPLVDLSRLKATSTRQRRALDLMRKEMSSRDISSCNGALSDGFDRDICDMIKSMKKKHELEEMLQSMFRFTLSLILGSTMTAAVLSNTYERYMSILKDQDDKTSFQEKTEAAKQLQYQLVKIFDLRRRCQYMQRTFRSIALTSRTLPKARRKRKRGKRQSSGPFIENTVSSNGSFLMYQSQNAW